MLARGVGLGLATPAGTLSVAADCDEPAEVVRRIEGDIRPRWIWWSKETPSALLEAGVRVATCYDIAAAHRLLYGGWRAEPALAWSLAHGLAPADIPTEVPPDLFSWRQDDGDAEDPVRHDGYLRPEWSSGRCLDTSQRLRRWAEAAARVAPLQQAELEGLADRRTAAATARSESAAELLCAELSADGLPMDRRAAEDLIGRVAGERPRSAAEAAEQRARRDGEVLRHVAGADGVDLRSPGQVRSLLRRVGLDLPDTRAARLRALSGTHPVVDALLAWRKAERLASTYGYGWLDQHLGDDGRLRGAWSGSDGAAGRMTASSGLHNMPAEMRQAVVAEEGHLFVRADLGQIEPRVLAAISGDEALARATVADDLYAPVAEQLAVDRATAKVAVLGAMYGQTTGDGARALRRLEAAYPVAMAYLADADRSGQVGQDVRTYGGRLIRLAGPHDDGELDPRQARGRAAARGRYGRNAVVQGAAAELFKVWAVTVRARAAGLDAQIVMCLHDELLVHAPADNAPATAQLVADCLQEAVRRWAPNDSVRFLADVAVIGRWSDAKPAAGAAAV